MKFLPFKRQVNNLLLGHHGAELSRRTLNFSADRFNGDFLADFADSKVTSNVAV